MWFYKMLKFDPKVKYEKEKIDHCYWCWHVWYWWVGGYVKNFFASFINSLISSYPICEENVFWASNSWDYSRFMWWEKLLFFLLIFSIIFCPVRYWPMENFGLLIIIQYRAFSSLHHIFSILCILSFSKNYLDIFSSNYNLDRKQWPFYIHHECVRKSQNFAFCWKTTKTSSYFILFCGF